MNISLAINNFMLTQPVGKFITVQTLAQGAKLSPGTVEYWMFHGEVSSSGVSPTILIGHRGGTKGFTRVEG